MNPVQRFINNTRINKHCIDSLRPLIDSIDNNIIEVSYATKTTKSGFLHILSFDNLQFKFINNQASIEFGKIKHDFHNPLQGTKIFTQFVIKGVPFNAESLLKNLSII